MSQVNCQVREQIALVFYHMDDMRNMSYSTIKKDVVLTSLNSTQKEARSGLHCLLLPVLHGTSSWVPIWISRLNNRQNIGLVTTDCSWSSCCIWTSCIWFGSTEWTPHCSKLHSRVPFPFNSFFCFGAFPLTSESFQFIRQLSNWLHYLSFHFSTIFYRLSTSACPSTCMAMELNRQHEILCNYPSVKTWTQILQTIDFLWGQIS